MKNRIQFFYAMCLAVPVFLFSSCEKILEEEPLSLATASGHYVDLSGLEDGLKACYTPLRSFYGDQGGLFYTVTGTDIYTNGFGGDKNFPAINNYSINFNSTAPFLQDIWNPFYIGINQCNTIAGRAPEVRGVSDAEIARITGEARFLRALYYFHLVQQFGDVHFTLEETVGVETEATRTPVASIYDQGIIPDLEYAIANLPVDAKDYGRANKGAAEALMARVQLVQQNYAEAQRYAENVINNYSYKLVKPFGDLWLIDNDVNEEIIWSVQYTDNPLTNGPGNSAHLYFVFDYTKNPAMTRDLENGRPFQRFMPTNYFLNMWDPEIDARWEGSFKTLWIANRSGTINDQTVSPGDTAIFIAIKPVDDQIQATVPYWYIDYNDEDVANQSEFFEIGGNNRRNFPVLKKYLDPLRSAINATDGRRDFPVIRLGEMYLIAAEAAFQQGETAVAAAHMNVLRERAAIAGKEAEMMVSAEELSLDFILDERAKELAGEMHRWYDLKRTGKLLDRVRAHNSDASPNIKEMHLVRPIPQTQIDRVSNPGDFPQNPGY
ncbi:RagB/SusD family nutrient uptake outer membrane protein [Flavilitoribacter nigricans]|uniref:RagB/SusD family nutrient uptake outer membrane protein n=1 Tax=Flavilitoribacter nigricans (strain ATCC 23147 / DSM 23189 / NBRC 102662 / NCIMB 1420 / SS-2) TaxID=1122177 RepID=A0A2D0MXT9_FLAN2|nr:RagB/SusD family nutrient uptake outer membrane protein [Flavilitoribacter nigricans]PHN01055.1 RagB/SusD family nutrient uptake outer membrane protein [Flavilitoribacter nigricans DSM 23189 = NBRC 102662]